MKILWIIADVLDPFYPFVKGQPSKGGSWIAPLFFNLVKVNGLDFGVVTPVIDGIYQKEIIEKVSYYSVPIKKGDNNLQLTNQIVENYLAAINDFQPDIIHINGTEINFGQVRNFLNKKIPIVVSIQGIINAYYPYLKLSISNINLKKYRSIKNWLGRGGEELRLKNWIRYSSIEKDIFKCNQYFIGRTIWDKAHVYALNPTSHYFHGEELLREPFYNDSQGWEIDNCERYQIFVSSAAYPIKGFHVLLNAIAILKHKYPKVKLVIPLASFTKKATTIKEFLFGDDYARFLRDEVLRLNLGENIKTFQRLSAEEMAAFYKQAHIFVLPSYVENSPNSLGEAMMVGTPTIVSQVGGIQSIIVDEESSLTFPSDDHAILAYQIERIFKDDNLAKKLSKASYLIAQKRHNIAEATIQYSDIYSAIIDIHPKNN